MAQNSSTERLETISQNPEIPDQLVDVLPDDRREPRDRRVSGWRSFLYGNFRPRRRFHRRSVDEYQIWFDWHEPRILFLALGIMLLSCTDALFTLNLLNEGATEGNVFMAAMLEVSVDRFLVVKFSITSFCLVLLVAATRRRFFGSFYVEHLLQVFCAGYFLLICYEIYLVKYVFQLSFAPGP